MLILIRSDPLSYGPWILIPNQRYKMKGKAGFNQQMSKVSVQIWKYFFLLLLKGDFIDLDPDPESYSTNIVDPDTINPEPHHCFKIYDIFSQKLWCYINKLYRLSILDN